jgi:hypothetical protein
VNDDDGIAWLGTLEERTLEPTSGWERAAAWLRNALKDGPRLSNEIRLLATGAGITPKQLRQARDEVVKGIKKLNTGQTIWALSPQALNQGLEGLEGSQKPSSFMTGPEALVQGHEGGNMPNMPSVTTCPRHGVGHEGNGLECPDCGRPFAPEEAHLALCPDCGSPLAFGSNGHDVPRQPAPSNGKGEVVMGPPCDKCGQRVRYVDAAPEGHPGWLRGECGCPKGIWYIKVPITQPEAEG